MNIKSNYSVFLCAICYLFIAQAHAQAQTQASAPVVQVQKVSTRNMAPVVWVPGTVISRQDSEIASEITGLLNYVAEVGDTVVKGQSLAIIDDRALQLELRNDESQILSLRARLTYTEAQLKRSKRIAETSGAAQSQVDELVMDRDVLIQEIEVAKVNRDKTLLDIERANILAPFDGIVVERKQWPGEHIDVGEGLLRLVNPNAIEISASAPITVNQFVEAGQSAAIRAEDDQRQATVRSIIPVGDAQSRMLQVRLTPSANDNWLVGEAVKIALNHGESKPSLAIPRDALVLREQSVYVFRINEQNIAERITVTPGDGNGSDISVVGSLKEGDQIVTRGAERLREGSTVEILANT